MFFDDFEAFGVSELEPKQFLLCVFDDFNAFGVSELEPKQLLLWF